MMMMATSNSNSNSNRKWGWKEIPRAIMDSILQRLPLSDFLQCKLVCPSWRQLVDSAISAKRCRPAPQPRPSIFLQFARSLALPLGNLQVKISKLSLPDDDPNDSYVGWIEGWLIKADRSGSIFTLLNPVSRGQLMLPRHTQDPATPFIRKAVASSVPFTTPHYQCIVACLSSEFAWLPKEQFAFDPKKHGGITSLAICRPSDKKWTPIHHQQLQLSSQFEDMEFIDRKLYAATKNPSQFLMVFHFDVDANDDIIQYKVERLITIEVGPEHARFEEIFKIKKRVIFLSKDFSTSKELFMITFADSFLHDLNNNYAQAFEVFKLDDANHNGGLGSSGCGGSRSRSRWVQIVKFRDRLSVLIQKIPQVVHWNISRQFGISMRDCMVQNLSLIRCRAVCLSPNPW